MSDKTLQRLNEIDRMLRMACPVGMNDGVHVTIELFSGFELFNTRPYHNYESWSDGYRVTGKGITVEREDLDDAVREWVDRVKASKAKAVQP